MSTIEGPDTVIGKSFLRMQEGLLEKHELQWDLNIIPAGTAMPTTSKLHSLVFKSGPLADLYYHILNVYQPEANKTATLEAALRFVYFNCNHYNKETSRFKLADGRTMLLTLDKAQMDFYSNGKVKDSHELTISVVPKEQDKNSHLSWSIKPDAAFTETQLTGDMVRYRLFLQVETGSIEGSFVRSCLNAPNMFLSEHLSDFRVVCRDGNKRETSFPAHRFVLAYNSPVLDRMIQSDMKEAREGRIVIEDMSEASLKELLRFMYTGKFVVTDDSTFELYKAADKYEIRTLQFQCHVFLLQQLSIQNAMDIYMLGESNGCKTMKDKSFQLIKKHKNNIFEDEGSLEEFSKKCPKLLLKLILEL